MVLYIAAIVLSLVAARWFKTLMIVTVGLLSAVNASLQAPPFFPPAGRDITFSGIVIGEDHQKNGIKLTVILTRALIKGDTIGLRLPVEIYTHRFDTYLGRRLVVRGAITSGRTGLGLNGFRGTIVTADLDPGETAGMVLYRARRHIDRLFKSWLGPVHYRLAGSLVLGGSSRVGEAMARVFTRAGVLHILSVSGLHVGFLITFIGLILVLVPLSMRVKYLIVVAVLFLYAGVTGFLPTVLRAGLMAVLFGLALVLDRNVESIHLVNVSALMLLIGSPGILLDVGAQLSYASIYGIVIWFPRIKGRILDRIENPWLRKLGSLASISVAAQVFVTPFLVHYFRQTQTMSVLSNLIVVPLSSLITYLLFGLALTGGFSAFCAQWLSIAAALLMQALVAVCRFFARWPWATVNLSIPPLILGPYFFLFSRRYRKPALWFMLAAALIISLSSLPACVVYRVEPENALLTLADGQNLLYTKDNGPSAARFAGGETVDYLIAEKKCLEPARDFIALPKGLARKRIRFGEVLIDLAEVVTMTYHGHILDLGKLDVDQGETLYVVARGDHWREFRVRSRGSILDDLITECRLVACRLWVWL